MLSTRQRAWPTHVSRWWRDLDPDMPLFDLGLLPDTLAFTAGRARNENTSDPSAVCARRLHDPSEAREPDERVCTVKSSSRTQTTSYTPEQGHTSETTNLTAPLGAPTVLRRPMIVFFEHVGIAIKGSTECRITVVTDVHSVLHCRCPVPSCEESQEISSLSTSTDFVDELHLFPYLERIQHNRPPGVTRWNAPRWQTAFSNAYF